MSDSLQAKVDALAERLDRVESELAVHRTIIRYGLAVDAGDAEATMALFTPDCTYEVKAVDTGRRQSEGGGAGSLVMRGREAVGEMVNGPNHQSLLPNASHTIGPFVVKVDGDEAEATGYSRIYHREGEDFRLFRLGMNHWKLVRREGRWLIHQRVSQAIGESDVQQLMRKGL